MNLPDCPADVRKRVAVMVLAESSPQARQAILQKCSDDLLWFVDYFCYTLDPRITNATADLPFFLYTYQRDTLKWIEARYLNHEHGMVEKSRDMGVTWLLLVFILHGWLFRPGFQALLGSRKEEEVDNFTTDSLFGKLEYLLEYLPAWMLPRGFVMGKHRRERRLLNPANGALVTGESSNPQFSRGKRPSFILMDEGAFWPDFESAWRAASQASKTVIPVSTPNGMEAFGRLRHNKQLNIPILRLHWSLHPHKNQDWYDAQKTSMTDVDIAQELDISYSRSVSGIVYPGWRDVPLGPYTFEPKWPLYVSMDFGIADPTAMIWAQRDPVSGRIRLLENYSNSGKPADFYIPFITGLVPLDWPYQYSAAEYELISRHTLWGYPIVFGDPAGNQRSQVSGESIISLYRTHGVHVVTKPNANDFPTRWNTTQLRIRQMECRFLNDESSDAWDCAGLNLAMLNSRFPETNPDKNSARLAQPIHNAHSHYRTALEYLCVNLPSFRSTFQRPDPVKTTRIYDNMR